MYYCVYGAMKLISLLPFCCIYLISDFLYYIVYYVVKYRRKVVTENLRYSFPQKTAKELQIIEKKFYHHFCDLVLETLKLISATDKQMAKRMKYINVDDMEKHYKENRSVMLLTSHYGNWEWTSTFSRHLPEDKPVYQVYKKLKSTTFDKIMYKIRKKFGAENVEMRNLLRTMIQMKNEGKLGLFGMLSDQSPNPKSIHYTTQFLSQKTAVITGTEKLAQKFDYPIYYVRLKKVKRGYYECSTIPLSLSAKDNTGFEVSEKYMRLLEQDILNAPEYWLWTHKRWKHTRK